MEASQETIIESNNNSNYKNIAVTSEKLKIKHSNPRQSSLTQTFPFALALCSCRFSPESRLLKIKTIHTHTYHTHSNLD